MKQKDPALGALALYAMLTAALLLLAFLGANLYASLTDGRAQDETRRATLAYIQSRVMAADAAQGVRVLDGPEGDALALAVDDSGYEVLIYCDAGRLWEQTSPAGSDFSTDAAQAIADCDSLALAWKTGATGAPVLEITANGANALVALRSGEEQAA